MASALQSILTEHSQYWHAGFMIRLKKPSEEIKIRLFFFHSWTLKPYQPLNTTRMQQWNKKWPYSLLHKEACLNIVLFGNWFHSADSFPTLWSHVSTGKVKKYSMKRKQGASINAHVWGSESLCLVLQKLSTSCQTQYAESTK